MRSFRGIAASAALVVLLFGSGCSGSDAPEEGGDASAETSVKKKSNSDDLTQQSAGDPSGAGYTPTGTLIADSGFRPAKHGFSFENYGESPPGSEPLPNLTSADVRKMFGDGACGAIVGDKCELTPSAEAWMEEINSSITGGHCYGFSVTAELFFQGKDDVKAYGADSAPALKINDNPTLARQLAYTWAFQTLPKVRASEVRGTPKDILEKLTAALTPDAPETFTIAIFKRDGSGGHAVTPFAVEDRGDGTFSVLIYDNNWPGVVRQITIDKNANTWTYVAATNPKEPSEIYEGDADTASLSLYPTNPGIGTQPCPFCGKVPDSLPPIGSGPATPELDLIYLDGSDEDHGHLLITDSKGRQVGYVDGKLVNNIPGAQVVRNLASKNWIGTIEPDYYVPTGDTYTIVLDGTGLKETDPSSIGIISSSFEMSADDINLDPGQKDTLVLGPYATKLSYTTNRPESPVIELGISDDIADYVFELAGESYESGSSINLDLPLDGSGLRIDTSASSGESAFDLTMTRTDDQVEEVFTHKDIALAGSDSAVLDYGGWDDEGEGIPFITTHDGVATTTVLTDG